MTDEAANDLTLADVLESAAAELGDVTDVSDAGVTVWAIGDVPFATLVGGRAEFRLDPLVVRAALRTADASPSSRGPDWVAFNPTTVDEAAADRADAWFLSAHRRAAGGPGRGG